MELNKWAFWWILLAYCFVSLILFMFTSGGFQIIVIFFFLGFIYMFILLLVLLITRTIIKEIIRISQRSLIIILLVQSIALLMNRGYCALPDTYKYNPGSFRFYERILGTNGWEYCNTEKVAALDFLGETPFWIYFVILIIVIIQIYYNAYSSFKKVSE